MKKAHALAILLGLAALAPFASSAKTPEEAYIESCRKDPGYPVPRVVVNPHVGAGYIGDKVEVEFIVDATGKPSAFKIKSHADDDLAEAVLAALKQWEFVPAERDGAPVATKVVLPVRVVGDGVTETRYAAN